MKSIAFVMSGRKHRYITLVANFLIIVCSSRTFSQGTLWHEAGGPYGGTVTAFAYFGGTLYAGISGSGVFLSTDYGTNWFAARAGLTNATVYTLAGAGTNLFAGTRSGVFLSTNFGTNWVGASTGLTNTYVNAVSVSASGGGTKVFAGTLGGVFFSADTGKSWSAANGSSPDTLKNKSVYALAHDTSGNLFAGTYGGGVFRSSDDGAHWTQVFPGYYIYSLAMKSDTIFAGTTTFFNSGAVYFSTNSGGNWSQYHTGLQHTTAYALALIGSNLYAGTSNGVYRTGEADLSWTQVNYGLNGDTLVHALAGIDDYLFAGSDIGGVYLSINDAKWTQVNTGLYTHVQTLKIFGPHVFAGTADAGVFFSIYGGTSWTQDNSGLTRSNIGSFTSAGTYLCAGTVGGVFSTHDGKNWDTAGYSTLNSNIHALTACLAPGLSGGINLYAGTISGVYLSTDDGGHWVLVHSAYVRTLAVRQSIVFAGTVGGGVIRSSADGTSWTSTSLTGNNVNALVVSGTTLCAAIDSGVVYRSTDDGDHWVSVYTNATDHVTSFAVSGSTLFAGTGGGHVMVSTDEGTTWSGVSNGLPAVPVSSLAVTGGDIFAGTYDAGVWTRTLLGIGSAAATVTLPVAGPTAVPRQNLLAGPALYDFNLPGDETTVTMNFTSISGFGTVTVERYESAPANPSFTGTPPANISQYHWIVTQSGLSSFISEVRFDLTRFSGGITNPRTVIIYSRPAPGSGDFSPLPTIFDSASNQLRATVSSFSEFIFGSNDNLLTNVRQSDKLPASPRLEQNFPNPFNPATIISYSLPAGPGELMVNDWVTLKVYDVLGKEVAVLADGMERPGLHSVKWDASALSGGIYFYRLQMRGFSETKKLLLIR